MPEPPRLTATPRLVIAFDFGLRRIGIAAGDTLSGQARPRGAARMRDDGPDWSVIDALLKALEPQLLVVGSPRNADGTPGRLADAADRFAAALQARAGLPVERTDEYGSSLEAAAELKLARADGARRRRVQRDDIDSAAAAIILERWLRNEGRMG